MNFVKWSGKKENRGVVYAQQLDKLILVLLKEKSSLQVIEESLAISPIGCHCEERSDVAIPPFFL
jgi:hypothetical protein